MMTTPWLPTLGAVLLVSALALAGLLAFAVDERKLQDLLLYLVSLASGALLGTALFHLLPEAIHANGTGWRLSLLLAVGFLGFFLLERLLSLAEGGHLHGAVPVEELAHVHADDHALHFHPHTHPHSHVHLPEEPSQAAPKAANLLLGSGIHSFIDGMAIATSFAAGRSVGVITTAAVMLHEIPHQIGNVGVLLHGGMKLSRAVRLNLLASLGGIAGALLVLLVGEAVKGFTAYLLPITTANFLYVAAADLMPELHHEHDWRRSLLQAATLLAGVSLVAAMQAVTE